MTLSTTLITRMQRKLAITNDQTIFTDAELNDLYDEASNDFYIAVGLGYLEIAGDAAKLNNFSAGQTKENKSEIYDHLIAQSKLYFDLSSGSNQMLIVGLRSVPPRKITKPVTQRGISPNDTTGLLIRGDTSADNFGLEFGPENDN